MWASQVERTKSNVKAKAKRAKGVSLIVSVQSVKVFTPNYKFWNCTNASYTSLNMLIWTKWMIVIQNIIIVHDVNQIC
jgi:hypothetical protein